MPYFKDAQNGLHFLSDDDLSNGGLALLPSECSAISDAEAAVIEAANVGPAAVLTVIYKSDIWARCTDQEAAILDGLLKAQPVKLQRLWADSLSLNITDSLYPMIHASCVQALGQTRADAILKPTE